MDYTEMLKLFAIRLCPVVKVSSQLNEYFQENDITYIPTGTYITIDDIRNLESPTNSNATPILDYLIDKIYYNIMSIYLSTGTYDNSEVVFNDNTGNWELP